LTPNYLLRHRMWFFWAHKSLV